ncbi:MAG TPA: molybdopterin-dependent oxidoreductase, partial [Polyangia bacterium]
GSATTVERRTVLQWLGNATVLALGGDLLSGCVSRSRSGLGGPDAGDASGEAGEEDFPFQPGDGQDAVFTGWYENTVDTQNLESILSHWQLTVDGMVGKPLVLTFADVLALPRQDQLTDFHCVEGWSVYDVPWNGASLSHMLDLAAPTTQATHITFHSIGGDYSESLPLDVAREPKTLLGYGVGGSTLPLAHGFPLRLVVPRLLGYKSAKYLERLELTDHAVDGYWEGYGYGYDGAVAPARLRPGKY